LEAQQGLIFLMDLYDDFQNNYPKVLRTQMMGPTVILLSEANPPFTADDDPDDLLALEDRSKLIPRPRCKTARF
jgi:hypothetical protein